MRIRSDVNPGDYVVTNSRGWWVPVKSAIDDDLDFDGDEIYVYLGKESFVRADTVERSIETGDPWEEWAREANEKDESLIRAVILTVAIFFAMALVLLFVI